MPDKNSMTFTRRIPTFARNTQWIYDEHKCINNFAECCYRKYG